MAPNNITTVHDAPTDVARECPQCGEASITTYWHHDIFTYGSGASAAKLHVDLPVRRCASCDLEFLDHEGERLRHEAVCRHLGVLSPAEIADIRKRFGMTRAVFAELTGLGPATLNRWENGAIVQNLANDRYLRLLALPHVMSRLQSLVSARRSANSAPLPAKVIPFRALTDSPQLRRDQASFQLRRAV